MSTTKYRSLLTRLVRLLFALALALAPILGLAGAPPALAASGGCVTSSGTVTCTFNYTGAAETWTVPVGVTSATFDLYGAGDIPGTAQGGRVRATLAVISGNTYQILVGGMNGFNGGGSGGRGTIFNYDGRPGGGASDVRVSPYALADRILVAGGAGGSSGQYGPGGDGGYPAGGNGIDGGGGGSQTSGGGGAPGAGAGSLGQGGTGRSSTNIDNYGGGGGGGGYYGGGGGRSCSAFENCLNTVGGGGGGSSYAIPAATNVSFENGVHHLDGLVIISYMEPDTIPPTSSAVTSPASPNGTNGWFTSDVKVSFTGTDNPGGSGVDRVYYSGGGGSGSVTPPGSITVGLSGDGTTTFSYYAVDNAGNTEPLNTLTIKIDATPPTISAAATTNPNANGWYRGDAVVAFSCADNLSGVARCPADQTLSGEGRAISSTAQAATDVAGNTSAPSNIVTVAIDRTAPSVSVTGVTDGASYPLGSVPAAGCSTSDALSGVASEATLSISGDNPNGAGSFSASCSGATDLAGNTASASVSYQVVYRWSGFFQPIDNLPTINSVKAGSAVPVKFSLGGNHGLSIFASGYPQVRQVTCDSGAPVDEIEQTVTAGASGLQYDPASGQYNYVWKTDKGWAGSCRQLVVRLVDGSEHSASFQFR